MQILFPPSLQKGDTVAFVAPSSPMRPERLELGIRYFSEKGFSSRVEVVYKYKGQEKSKDNE
jgi:muramoyltetrapeptide carboxypeptidase